MFLDGLFWSKVLRILFFSINSTCSIFLSLVFVVFVLLVVSRVKSYVHIVLVTRTPVRCPNSSRLFTVFSIQSSSHEYSLFVYAS